ncbi:hypothetical protein LL912_06150 [Niabella sp. CC-SYL272]|uniref:hypothetical protein n=1 Tax=Niabella agricola TaxID=2891571 RepID=UPI001F3D6C9C|nr:hypothetical protein [Niabella agricola]MCF3108354.1 hypothetical protein [Niabella agricola]
MKEQPFESSEHDLVGYASLDLKSGQDAFLTAIFPNYNPQRFVPVSIKVAFGKEHLTITLYAHAAGEQPETRGELPVKKFKGILDMDVFANYVKHFSVSFSNDRFDIDQMRVINR